MTGPSSDDGLTASSFDASTIINSRFTASFCRSRLLNDLVPVLGSWFAHEPLCRCRAHPEQVDPQPLQTIVIPSRCRCLTPWVDYQVGLGAFGRCRGLNLAWYTTWCRRGRVGLTGDDFTNLQVHRDQSTICKCFRVLVRIYAWVYLFRCFSKNS
jgi:hypothetical protein